MGAGNNTAATTHHFQRLFGVFHRQPVVIVKAVCNASMPRAQLLCERGAASTVAAGGSSSRVGCKVERICIWSGGVQMGETDGGRWWVTFEVGDFAHEPLLDVKVGHPCNLFAELLDAELRILL